MIIGGDLLIRGPRAVTRNGFEYDNFEKTDIASLEPLRPVLAVRGSVNLQRNPKLDSLSGLENLRWVGESLRIEGNEGLEDLQGLDSLERVGGNLRIFAEPPLRSLRGLESLRTIEDTLTLARLEALGSLSALQLSRPPAEIELTDVDALTSLQGLGDDFEATTEPYRIRRLELSKNDALRDLADLVQPRPNAPVSVTETLAIWNNPALTAIPEVDPNFATGRVRLGAEEPKLDASGLDGTSYTRLIVVGKIPELPVQAGLTGDGDGDRHPPLERLVVRENPLIRTLAGVRPRRAPVGIQLVDNPELRDVSALADLESIRNLALTRNSRLESVEFRGLDRIGPKGRIGAGTLEIRGNKRLRTVDFATSESASDGRAFGSVNIVKTSRLTSIQGWPSRVSRLAIVRNDSLVRLGPEGVFDTVDRAIQIRGNPKLTSLGALSKARGADRIRIDNNDTLTGLSALSRFKQLVRLQITGNDGLTSLRGLKALTSVEELIVQGNACLPSSEVDWLMKRLKKKSLVSRTTERNGGGPGCSSD